MTEDLEAMRKRLVYRAHHRGMKEMDLILGPFADAHVAQFDADDLRRFEALLEVPDADFLSWITGQTPVPDDADTKMIGEVSAFARKGVAR